MKDNAVPIRPLEAPHVRMARLHRAFEREFGSISASRLFAVSIPLRICPLGAHSDHQGGLVTGFAIDRSIDLVGAVTQSPQAEVLSSIFNQRTTVAFGDVPPKTPGHWSNYLRGAVLYLAQAGVDLRCGFQGIVDGAMPIGGLSSSAAVSIAYLTALLYAQGIAVSKADLVALVSQIENGYLGLHNGILDQSVIVYSTVDSLTVVDCRDSSTQSLACGSSDEPWEILVVYSGLSRQLTATPFNQRVAECRDAARELLTRAGNTVAENVKLGDVPREVYEAYEHTLSETSRKRARHFFSEAARVQSGIKAWSCGDIRRFGALVSESGRSSIVNYESGSPALVALYEILSEQSGVYGARFCGGGFQGCCLALIDPTKRDAVVAKLHERYTERHPELADTYSVHFCQTSCLREVREGV
jgi:galacturonokinase